MPARYKSILLLAACCLFTFAGAAQAGKPCKLDAPTVTCIGATASSITLQICAGASGAPAGISIHWSTCADYIANGNHIPDPGGGGFAISLSGNCQQGGSPWNLGPGDCKTITINASTIINAQAEGCGASCNTDGSGCPTDLLCNTCYRHPSMPQSNHSCNFSYSRRSLISRTLAAGGGDVVCADDGDRLRDLVSRLQDRCLKPQHRSLQT